MCGKNNVTARAVAETARSACVDVAAASTDQKDAALLSMAEKLQTHKKDILVANEADMTRARNAGLPAKMVNRLRFGEEKIGARIRSLLQIVNLPEPVGQVFRSDRCANGLQAARVRVPIGVILMIYEARPHVTVNAGALCLKAGNACILRGGSEAKQCNQVLGELWRNALCEARLPDGAIQVISGAHEDIDDLLQEDTLIDLVIPRGGKDLITAVTQKSRVPVLKHFDGVCHVYIDWPTPLHRAIKIALDSKCLMPEVCNAMETLLVHAKLKAELPQIVEAFRTNGVEVRGCEATRLAVPDVPRANEHDWREEYLDTIVSVRVVADVGEAIKHINRYGSHHTDAIVTDNNVAAQRFCTEVDSAVVLVNASTMFCDGESLGMGAEIGISTDRIHARGPMGLEELTSYKHVIHGDGHVMGELRTVPKEAGQVK
jgi:glutamate-5-semialdehyde dehydrogenase